jgi:hypothetical protein
MGQTQVCLGRGSTMEDRRRDLWGWGLAASPSVPGNGNYMNVLWKRPNDGKGVGDYSYLFSVITEVTK